MKLGKSYIFYIEYKELPESMQQYNEFNKSIKQKIIILTLVQHLILIDLT